MFETLFIIALVVLAYYPTINYLVVVDDGRRQADVEAPNSVLIGTNIFDTIVRRFQALGTLAMKTNIGGSTLNGGNYKVNLKHEHVFTIAQHALNCVLMYFAFGQNQVSLFAAILYALNPINNQTSVWLNGRRYATNITIVLLILISPWALILYPLAMSLQVSAVFAPILLGLPGIILSAITTAVFWPKIKDKIEYRKQAIKVDDLRNFTPKKLIPITKFYGAYMLKMIFPGRTMMNYNTLFYWGLTEDGNKDAYTYVNKEFLLGVSAVVLSVAGAWYFHAQPHLLTMWLFMCLSTAQWCGFISVNQLFSDRYVSLPNVFMMFFVSYFIHQIIGAYALPVLVAIATYYLTNLRISIGMYKDMEAFWNYHIYYNPKNIVARHAKASFLLAMRDPLGAWEVVRNGLKLNSTDFKLNILAAQCMHVLEDQKSTVIYLRLAKKCCYINQEFVLDSVYKNIFGIDIKAEVAKIDAKESAFSRPARENIKKIYETVSA